MLVIYLYWLLGKWKIKKLEFICIGLLVTFLYITIGYVIANSLCIKENFKGFNMLNRHTTLETFAKMSLSENSILLVPGKAQ